MALAKKEINKLDKYFRALNYLSVAQLYLLDNPLLRRELTYKDIKYYEVDSHETRGVIYGYGVRRILIAIGKGIDEIYLITPANEDKFIELLEKKINMAKRNTR